MNRIERISAILIQLQSKKIVRAQEIADRFEISLRTVYRDIRSLEETGVPIMGEAGVGYSLVDGYKLPPIMFTKEEAISFLTAEKLVQKFTDQATKNSYNAALYKIKAVLKTGEKSNLESLSEHIEVLTNPRVVHQEHSNTLEPILKGISDNRQIKIQYFTNHSQQKSERIIEPVGIFHSGANWYVVAFCLLRNDYRNFKINRIESLEILENKYHKQHPSLKSFLEKTSQERQLEKVVLHVERKILRYLGDEKYFQGFISQTILDDKTIEMTFLTASLIGFSRWILYLGEFIEIIEPPTLKAMFIENVKKLSKKYLC